MKPTRFHLSPSGNDAWSGRLAEPAPHGSDGPFATLERARAAVRECKRAGPLPRGGVELGFLDGVDCALVQVSGNLIAGAKLGTLAGKDGVKPMTAGDLPRDNQVMEGDPGFVGLKGGNFQLRDDSPAYALGFQRIPIEKFGLTVDAHRRKLPGRKTLGVMKECT